MTETSRPRWRTALAAAASIAVLAGAAAAWAVPAGAAGAAAVLCATCLATRPVPVRCQGDTENLPVQAGLQGCGPRVMKLDIQHTRRC